MRPTAKFVGFALSVDIFNRMVYCEPFKNKKKKELEKCFTSLFARSGVISTVVTDGELEYMRPWMEQKKMFLRTKPKDQHVK